MILLSFEVSKPSKGDKILEVTQNGMIIINQRVNSKLSMMLCIQNREKHIHEIFINSS